MSRPTGITCDDCGGPMEVFSRAGQEPDPDHPGHWRPTTTCSIRCANAFAEWKEEMHAAQQAVTDKHRHHLRHVTAPWPLPRLTVVKW